MIQSNGKQTKTPVVIWAVDPFLKERTLQRAAGLAIKAFIQGSSTQVQPVCCADVYGDDLIQLARMDAQKYFDQLAKPLGMGTQLLPVELIAKTPVESQRDTVDRLLKFAKEKGAELIVLGTHARSGPQRWMIGSFVETLLLRSDVPALVVNPSWRKREPIKHILFPTDFSDESKQAFGQILKTAKARGLGVTLFHRLKLDYTPRVEELVSLYPIYRDVFKREAQAAKTRAAAWAAEGGSLGVKVSVDLDVKPVGSVVDAILKRAKKAPSMIAMASHSGAVASALLGSTTRKVLRSAHCPVWVVHPDLSRASGQARSASPGKALFTVKEEDVMGDLAHAPHLKTS